MLALPPGGRLVQRGVDQQRGAVQAHVDFQPGGAAHGAGDRGGGQRTLHDASYAGRRCISLQLDLEADVGDGRRMVVALGSQPQPDTLELDTGTIRDPAQVADEAGADRGEQRLDRARPVDVVLRRGVEHAVPQRAVGAGAIATFDDHVEQIDRRRRRTSADDVERRTHHQPAVTGLSQAVISSIDGMRPVLATVPSMTSPGVDITP
jgi:hypothetical protein